MLGSNLFKLDNSLELTNDKLKSLVVFYLPLIGNDSLVLYEYLLYKHASHEYQELNVILNDLGYSIDLFEKCVDTLNQFKLIQTLKGRKKEAYLFRVKKPLGTLEFAHDKLLPRMFYLKVGKTRYQDIISTLRESDIDLNEFEDISSKIDYSILKSWDEEDEKSINKPVVNEKYDFKSLFDINYFLKDCTAHLFPLKYRTEANLREICTLADLYNISYDRMRICVKNAIKSGTDLFDITKLRYSCMISANEYKKCDSSYALPCITFLMNLQEGKEVTEEDRKILMKLAFDYHLRPEVINVLIEHCLKSSNNRLIKSFVFAVASDMHRNDINTSVKALEFLNKNNNYKQVETKPSYDATKNSDVDLSVIDDFFKE